MKRLWAGAVLVLAACSSAPLEPPSGDGAFTISVGPSDPVAPKDQLISLDSKGADLARMLDLIARSTKLGILLSPGVQGSVTMKAHQRPVGEVVEEMARLFNGKVVFVNDSLVRVVPQ